MRSFKWAVAAFALSGLTGCFGNSDPELYRVAVAAPPATLAASCYRNNTVPTDAEAPPTNSVEEEDWVLWDGVDDVKYLDVGGRVSAGMAEAPDVNIPVDAVEGTKNDDGKYVFTVERTERDPDETVVTAATYTFDEVGQTVEGTVTFRSSCTGTGCPAQLSCEQSRRFVGRRIDGDRFIIAGTANN